MNTAKTSGKPILDATSILFAFSMGNFRRIGGVMPVIGKTLHVQVINITGVRPEYKQA